MLTSISNNSKEVCTAIVDSKLHINYLNIKEYLGKKRITHNGWCVFRNRRVSISLLPARLLLVQLPDVVVLVDDFLLVKVDIFEKVIQMVELVGGSRVTGDV